MFYGILSKLKVLFLSVQALISRKEFEKYSTFRKYIYKYLFQIEKKRKMISQKVLTEMTIVIILILIIILLIIYKRN